MSLFLLLPLAISIPSLKSILHNTAFIRLNVHQFHQVNQSFACLKFHKHNCVAGNILAGNICFRKPTGKESIKMNVKDSKSVSSSDTFKPRKLA